MPRQYAQAVTPTTVQNGNTHVMGVSSFAFQVPVIDSLIYQFARLLNILGIGHNAGCLKYISNYDIGIRVPDGDIML